MIPLGQRYIESVLISGTDVLIEHDALNFYNNPALHQCLEDDVKRTVIVGLDVPHRVIQLRLGKVHEKYPTLYEMLWSGALRALLSGFFWGAVASLITGDSMIGQQAFNYVVGNVMKEGWLRTGWGRTGSECGEKDEMAVEKNHMKKFYIQN